MKTPILVPEYDLPELECEKGWQAIKIEFRDDANDLLIEVMVTVYVKFEKKWRWIQYALRYYCKNRRLQYRIPLL